MSGQPVRVFALEVKPGDPPVPVNGEGLPAQVRITMAAIDPTAPAQLDMAPPGQEIPRATLKLIKINTDEDMQDSEDEEDDYDEDDVAAIERRLGMAMGDDVDDEDDDSEAENGGPSDKKTRQEILTKLLDAVKNQESSDEDEDMEVDDLPNGVNGTKSKKGKAIASEDDEDIESDSDEDFDDVVEHAVVCTLDTTHHFQQPIDIVVGENEQIYVESIGTHSVYLTGNYIAVLDDDDEDDSDYSDEDDEMGLYGGELDGYGESDEESDELDDMADPRVTEVDSEEEAPALVKAPAAKKGKNKRPAEEDDDASTLDDLIRKSKNEAAATNGDSKQSKKKLKNNEGQAVAGADKKESKKEAAEAKQKTDKKVQFAKNLELGPTGSPKPVTKAGQEKHGAAKEETKPAIKGALGVKKVNGVTIDDKKIGKGPAAKTGDKIGMRYIGKLENGKIFDSNKKGKPFTFTLGKGEVIKGWDIGVAGMTAGAERRITVPASLAYKSKALPGIPANSTLVFDVKCLSVN